MDRSGFLTKVLDFVNDLYARVVPRVEVRDEDFLFRRIHPTQIQHGELTSSAFDDVSMSTDLESLTTPQKSIARARSPESGLVKISVKFLRELSVPQTVKHWPTIPNYSHSLAVGQKSRATRQKIKKAAIWVIKPSAGAEKPGSSAH